MEGIFEFWYLLPISIIIATIAISSGIGVFVSGYLPGNVLMIIFAIGIIFVGSQLFLSYKQDRETDKKLNIPLLSLDNDFESELTDYKGNIYRYTICNKPLARLFSLIGGLFFGMISVGLAELQEYQLLVRCRIPTRIAVATSIFLVAVTAFAVAGIRVLMEIVGANYNELSLIGKIILFTAPGVLIGGQIGPFVQHKIDPKWMKLFIAVTLVAVGLFLVFSLII